jgi:two-component sensor histidine kinase
MIPRATANEDDLDGLRSRIAELESQLKDKELELEALRQIGLAMGSLFDIEEMLRQVADIIVHVTGTDLCLIYLLNQSGKELVLRAASRPASGFIGNIRLRIGEGVTGWVARERRPVVLDKEAWRDYRFKEVPSFYEDTYQSMLSVPLLGKEELVGVINVRTNPPHEYTSTQVALLSSIANQVGAAVENFLHFQKVEKQASHLSTLSEISRTITSDLYLEEVLHLIVAMTADSMNFRICSVMLLDEDKRELVIKATQSESSDYVEKPNLKLGESVAGRAVSEGRPISVLDVRKTAGYRYPDVAKREGLCSLIAVPLNVKGKAIGVLNCYTAKPHVFTEEEIALLEALANHAAIAIENAKLMVRSAIIQEMHHRVKNSLQTIASLLRLQIRYGKPESIEQVLNESINRILAIASVHELLSSENLDSVSVKKVAEGILAGNARSLIPPDKNIDLTVDGVDVMLPARKATSVALILNELVQNAIEHGFKSASWGKVMVSIRETTDMVRLSVTNDGELLPPDFDLRQQRNLGLQIVENLVRDDLNGEFTLVNDSRVIKSLVIFPK